MADSQTCLNLNLKIHGADFPSYCGHGVSLKMFLVTDVMFLGLVGAQEKSSPKGHPRCSSAFGGPLAHKILIFDHRVSSRRQWAAYNLRYFGRIYIN